MNVINSDAGLFGPFDRIENLGDRLRVWALGTAADALGADLALCVIGNYELLDVDVPTGFVASDYMWDGIKLRLVATTPSAAVLDEAPPQQSMLTRLFSKL